MILESLEERRLMSISLSKGVLIIRGTNQPDSISVTPAADRFVVGVITGDPTRPWDMKVENKIYRPSQIKSIRIYGNNGDDQVAVWLPGFTGSTLLEAGNGNDTATIDTKGRDTLRGGAGNDELDARAGNDVLDGGAGDDDLSGGSGNDAITGGAGHDTLDGGAHNDVLYGKDGTWDTFFGGGGSDTAYTDKGKGLDHKTDSASVTQFKTFQGIERVA